MSKKSPSGGRSADYEVGHGKPPKEHRFKPKNMRAGTAGSEKRRKKRKSSEPQTVDVYALLTEPVQVRKGERVQSMDPFEAMLRKQLELALKERSAAAMKWIFDIAIEYQLITKPPKTNEGGVLMVPLVTKADLEFFDTLRTHLNNNRNRVRR